MDPDATEWPVTAVMPGPRVLRRQFLHLQRLVVDPPKHPDLVVRMCLFPAESTQLLPVPEQNVCHRGRSREDSFRVGGEIEVVEARPLTLVRTAPIDLHLSSGPKGHLRGVEEKLSSNGTSEACHAAIVPATSGRYGVWFHGGCGYYSQELATWGAKPPDSQFHQSMMLPSEPVSSRSLLKAGKSGVHRVPVAAGARLPASGSGQWLRRRSLGNGTTRALDKQ